ncbi:hypothetical protein [Mycobacterium sp. E2479]|uniref:hypothetical protein n=1 Tax=Mycobacterium sp. E2479 TaxID=1834134 RepID=UPI0008006A43|nr:hypothetical protein [Mycobacterium sp. E2479]OBH55473.1 hypothetical protein A5686_06430 [Mycobacterium sp. E2479]
MSAGQQLRAALDAALKRESKKLGQPVRWDERERQHVDAACRAADAVELLDQRITAEQAGEQRGSIIVKYLAERRLQDDKVSEHLRWLQLDEFAPLKSPQHVAAGQARWAGVQRGRKGTA